MIAQGYQGGGGDRVTSFPEEETAHQDGEPKGILNGQSQVYSTQM